MGRASRRKQQRRNGTAHVVAVKPSTAVLKAPAIRRSEGPLTPTWELDRFAAALLSCAGEMIPMWAAITILSGTAMGKAANSCAYASYQLAGALRHLGYDAEPIAACVNVRSLDGSATDVGVWEHPPRIRGDGTTNGHVVVWASSFRRLIDLTVCQDPQLQRAARQNPDLAAPVVGELQEFAAFGEGPTPMVARPPFVFTYMLLPQYTRFMAPLWENSAQTEQLDLGALAFAHDTLELVRTTESRRRRASGARIRALVDGKAQLPPLPAPA
jgi:hypothetical protein